MATTTQTAPPKLTANAFLYSTRPKRQLVSTNVPYVDGGITRHQMPQAGLIDNIIVYIGITIVVAGTVTGGTFQGFSYGNSTAPWTIIKNVQFASNNNLLLRNHSGWSWYKWFRARSGIDPTASVGVNYSPNTLTALGINQSSNKIVGGAAIAAGTYTANMALEMPIAYNQDAEQSLLSLQANNIIYTLSMQWGQITGNIGATGGTNDLFNTLVGTGLSVTSTISVSVECDTWDVPQVAASQLSTLMSTYTGVVDGTQNPLITGTNVFKPATNDVYTIVGLEFINNNAPVSVGNIQNPSWQYASGIFPFQDNYTTHLVRDWFQHGIPSIDGNVLYDLGTRRGILKRRDLIDAFNDQNITNLQVSAVLPGTLSITGTNQINWFTEYVNAYTQPSPGF